jgi:hypothetical protein
MMVGFEQHPSQFFGSTDPQLPEVSFQVDFITQLSTFDSTRREKEREKSFCAHFTEQMVTTPLFLFSDYSE